MKRGGVRTSRKYVTDEQGNRLIKFEIQGRRRGTWIPVVETNNSTKAQTPMIYNTLKEAEIKLKEIAKSIRGENAKKIKAKS
jgi:hypothetical protein